MDIADRPKVDRKARFQIPEQKLFKQDPVERRCNWNEVVLGFADNQAAMVEATRCIQCPGAPCIKACPVHNDIPSALWQLEQGDFIGAANVFRETSTMPEVCGRICPQERLCEGSCVVGNEKRVPPARPVAIGRLEAFVSDYQRQTEGLPLPALPPSSGRKIAVIGAGPAGMTVAELVARQGHGAVIFDEWPTPGGILVYGIPNFKMGKQIAEDKVELLEAMGVRFVQNTVFGRDVTLDGLLSDGFDAVFLGHGAGIGSTTGIPGEDLANIHQATDFLVRGNLSPEELPAHQQEPVQLGRKVVIVGGGDTSMDCVRTAVRLAYEAGHPETEVTCLYRRTETEMPGREEERRHAKEEGVQFRFLTAPAGYVDDGQGRVKGVKCVHMVLGKPDESGRSSPVQVPDSEHVVAADTVVLAVGYWADQELVEGAGLAHRTGTVVVNPETGETSRPGVFAGGDSVRGADLVVTAVAEGQRAALGIMQYLEATAPAIAGRR